MNINLIQFCASTIDAFDEILQAFYEQSKNTLYDEPKKKIIIVGDMNAKVRRNSENEKQFSDRGNHLIQFRQKQSLAIATTFFKHHAMRLNMKNAR